MNDKKENFIVQKRSLTFLFAFLFLFLATVFLVEPILTYILPLGVVGAALLKLRIASFVFAICLGVPLFLISFSLFIRLRLKYAVKADEKGLYIYTSIIPLGFIPFDKIANIEHHSELSQNGISRNFQILMKPNVAELNLKWKIREKLFRKKQDKLRLIISFLLCNDKDEVNAEKIIRLWNNYCGLYL